MMACWVVLCKIVGKVGGSFIPVDTEVVLLDAVLDPEVAHVHRFGALGLERTICNAVGSAVVRLDWGRALRKAEFAKGSANRFRFTTVVEDAAEFAFRG